MGKIDILTPKQQRILSLIGENDFLRTNFYFTGGTALSAFYLNHRLSDDLDFFSLRKFDTQSIFTIISDWAKRDRFTFQPQYIEPAYITIITFPNQEKLKADFVYYPFRQLEKGQALKGRGKN